MTSVVHCKRDSYDIYIGRTYRGSPGGPFGNPFKIPTDGNREEVIEKYRQWLFGEDFKDYKQTQRTEIIRRIKNGELKDKILGCWCKPEACHGDLLADIVNNEYELI